MRKIPTLFLRDWDGNPKYVTKEPNPECAWVFARREVKPGKAAPPNFRPISTDDETGKTIGWEPIEQSSFARWHTEALEATQTSLTGWPVGTYEMVGPKVNGNPEQVIRHYLWAHSAADVLDAPRDHDGLRAWLTAFEGEGIVWHHPDGRMAKIKARDFPAPGATP